MRYFIAENRDLKRKRHKVRNWKLNAFMPLKAVEQYEDNWDVLKNLIRKRP